MTQSTPQPPEPARSIRTPHPGPAAARAPAPAPASALEPDVDRAAAATAAKGRSLAPDLARGMMLLLIALANAQWWLWGDRERGMTNGHPMGQEGADLGYQLFSLVTIDGRAYPLFAFLFGYGIWQMYARQAAAGTDKREAHRLLQRRHWWMLLLGAVHALLLWFGDVIGAYAITGLIIVAAFLRRSDRVLKICAWILAALLGVTAVLGLVSGLVFSTGVLGGPESFGIEESGNAMHEMVAGEADYVQFAIQSFLMWLPNTALQVVMLTIPLAALLGILAARRGMLDRPAEHRSALVRIAVGGIAIGWLGGAIAAAQFAGLLLPPSLDWALMGLTSLAGVAGGIGYAALIGLIAAAIGQRRGPLTTPITALGKRSLTGYLLQSVLFAVGMAAWGFGLGAQLGPLATAGYAVGVWLVTVLVAWLLDRAGKRGPAEMLLRRLQYGREGARRIAPPSEVRSEQQPARV